MKRCFLPILVAVMIAVPGSYPRMAIADEASPQVDAAHRESTAEHTKKKSLRDMFRAIDPQGIAGSLVLAGRNPPDQAIERFFDLAKRDKARVVVLRVGSDDVGRAEVRRLVDAWDASESGVLEIRRIRETKDADDPKLTSTFKEATAIWLAGDDSAKMRELFVGAGVQRACRALLQRGGVVGGSAAAAAIMSRTSLADDRTTELVAGIDLLPSAVIDVPRADEDTHSRIARVVESQPELVGYEISSDGGLIVRGRRLQAVGDGTVTVRIAAGAGRPAIERVLQGRSGQADLTTLRRIAIARTGEPFPPAEPESPLVEKGSLIIVGGGGMPQGLLDRFVKLAGGSEASIVVLPTAIPDPLPKKFGIAEAFRNAGAKKVTVLRARARREVESDDFLETVRNATGIWFGGGRQWRFVDAYLDTKAARAMHDVLRRGGVIAGSSAGASIQAQYMARGNPLGNRNIMAEGYQRGLGFLKGVAIDQHFSQRNRQPDMTGLVDTYPQLLGIGVDESTAIVVQGRKAEVVGRHRVCFYDRNKPVKEDELDYEFVHPGGRYDLVARKILDPGVEQKQEKDEKKKEKEKEEKKDKTEKPKKDANPSDPKPDAGNEPAAKQTSDSNDHDNTYPYRR